MHARLDVTWRGPHAETNPHHDQLADGSFQIPWPLVRQEPPAPKDLGLRAWQAPLGLVTVLPSAHGAFVGPVRSGFVTAAIKNAFT